ncbi:hypothetical protein BDB00DRAFT_807162 [Zychaea mexicana]|uniref:uncharacterized protein n=1 Tax=Zychaea mexicana TaxID=64656 RepID=UPI0022FE0E6B|nr:uncharacterized protein BDB00DRAFT_807162 [Zychaea mexicana]KAI9496797.1 hypothetical protein BDB00DRAFT_807162 [Zychaea mexicana]
MLPQSILSLLAMIALATTSCVVNAYMNEPYPPFVITSPKHGQIVKQGDAVKITWELSPDTKYPLYGYAASRTSRTVGKGEHAFILHSIMFYFGRGIKLDRGIWGLWQSSEKKGEYTKYKYRFLYVYSRIVTAECTENGTIYSEYRDAFAIHRV